MRTPRAGSERIIHVVTYARNEASDLECKLIEARDGMLPSTWAADIRVQVSLGTAKELLGKVVSDLIFHPVGAWAVPVERQQIRLERQR